MSSRALEDARPMALTPDLLEVCKDLLLDCLCLRIQDGCDPLYTRAMEKARAKIAEAEGRP